MALAIPAAVVARLGPWLARVGAVAAEKAVTAVRGAGATGVNTVQDIARYASSSSANAIVVFSSLASAGFAVSDLFSPADKQDSEVRASAASFAVKELEMSNQRLIEIAGESEKLKGISGDRKDLVLLQRVLRFAKGHYGSAGAAIEAWKSHQAFFELSLEDVETGFNLLDV